jgi:pyrrolidone-carboxylate peptidase
VSFEGVDRFLAELEDWEAVLMLGVSAQAEKPVLETVARNWFGPSPDVQGVAGGPAPIHPQAPAQLGSTLFRREELYLGDRWTIGTDAGDYFCNYLLFRMLWEKPNILAGFIHIPPFETMPQAECLSVLNELAVLMDLREATLA